MLFIVITLVIAALETIKEMCHPTIPAENWANKKLYYENMVNGVSPEQLTNNLSNGKYKIDEAYPEPHRNTQTGKIIIENDKLYKEDVKMCGILKAREWMYQGKYNLEPEELKKRQEEINKEWEHLYNLL
jgi:hypothetical protein